MDVRFVYNNKLLEFSNLTDLELRQVQKVATGQAVNWKGQKWEECMLVNYRYLSAGLWSEIAKLKKYGITVNWLNFNEFYNEITKESFDSWLESIDFVYPNLRYYQTKAAHLLLQFPYSSVEVAAGGGKTFSFFLICKYIKEFGLIGDKKILILMPKTLINQTITAFGEFIPDDNKPLKIASVHHSAIKQMDADVVLGNVETLVNYEEEYFKVFGAFYIDEAHKAKSASIRTVSEMLDNEGVNFIGGMTGTYPKENSVDEIRTSCIVGAPIYRVTPKELSDGGYITKAKIRIVNLEYSKEHSEPYFSSFVDNIAVQRLRNRISGVDSVEVGRSVLFGTLSVFRTGMSRVYLSKTDAECNKFAGEFLQQNSDATVIAIPNNGKDKSKLWRELENVESDIDIFISCELFENEFFVNKNCVIIYLDSKRVAIGKHINTAYRTKIYPSYKPFIIDPFTSKYRNELYFLNEDTDRTDYILKTANHLDKNQLFLYTSKVSCYSHAEYAKQQYPERKIYVITGDTPQAERDIICRHLETIDNAWIFAITRTMDTGVSINNLFYLHLIDSGKSFYSIMQSIGRIVRLHKSKEYAIFFDWTANLKREHRFYYRFENEHFELPKTASCARQLAERIDTYNMHKYEHTTVNVKESSFRKTKHNWNKLIVEHTKEIYLK